MPKYIVTSETNSEKISRSKPKVATRSRKNNPKLMLQYTRQIINIDKMRQNIVEIYIYIK